MKKTVEEIMKAAPETIFYIGSASGYFFIGNYEAWKRDGQAINEKCRRAYESAQLAARKNTEKTLKELEYTLTAKKVDRSACVNRLSALNKISETLATEWVDIGNRVPEKIYEKEAERGYALVTKGLEEGRYWMKNEYDTKYDPKHPMRW